jgi:fibronectin-binding autotransporter adhesin
MPFYKIIASQIGNDAGPFVIKSNTGAILATGVTRQQLLDGFVVEVPSTATSISIENVATNTLCTGVTTLPIPQVGRWEMEKANVETISDHYGVILAPYTAPVESFVAQDIVGIYAGVVSDGTGIWTIKGTPEDIAGTTYNQGGTLILTGLNTNSQTTVQGGAILQLGFSTDSYTGQVGANLTINTGGIVNVVGANDTERRAFGILVNNGQMNITGPDRCGEGYFRNGGNITQNNGATITIDKANFRLANPTNFASTGGGFIDVKDGATFANFGNNIPANHTLKLAGCGKCNEIGGQDGALLVSGGTTISAPIILQSEVCMDWKDSGTAIFNGPISGNFKIKLNNQADSSTRQGTFAFQNPAPYFDNTLEVKNTSLYNTSANALSKADVVFVENAGLQSDGGAINLGSLASDSTTSYLLLNSSGSITLKENGSTTYAGTLQNSTPGTPWTFKIEGPDTNVIKLTGAGNLAVALNSTLGGRIIVENGRYNAWSGLGTISAGSTIATATTSRIDILGIQANSALDVYASGNTTGLLYGASTTVQAGWKVNLMEPLPAGTHRILWTQNSALTLPILGTNLSGRTVTGFANSVPYITVTLV